MKLTIPKITQPIPLTDYAPEMVHDDGTAAVVWVWVNPPAALIGNYSALRGRAQAARKQLEQPDLDPAAVASLAQELADVGLALYDLFAQLWSARADPATHWTAEDVATLANDADNPALWGWLTSRTTDAVSAYRLGLQKK